MLSEDPRTANGLEPLKQIILKIEQILFTFLLTFLASKAYHVLLLLTSDFLHQNIEE